MIFEKFIDTDLGHVSYIIACGETGDALIVDPRRDIAEYSVFLEKNSLNLRYVFNTHTHADYIGGHVELATQYNINNIFHDSAPIENFSIVKVKENDKFCIGSTLKIKILETPGHTPFDISLLLSENNVDKYLFTGDFLFVGDIGRPDLLGEENRDALVNSSFNSAKKLWNLSDDILVFTSHIEGSLCGKNLSRQYFSTIGIEKKANYSFSLCQQEKEHYIENLTSQNIETPAFFKIMAGMNIAGPKLIKDIVNEMKIVEFDDIKDEENIQIIDLREPKYFHRNHISGSINICEKANVSLIAGNLIDYNQKIYLVGNLNSKYDDFIIKLLRVGLDNIAGIINSDFSVIDSQYLSSSNIISKDQIDNSYANILLDKDCSDLGNTIQSNFSKARVFKINEYSRIIFSCNFGYKSSAILSMFQKPHLFYVEDI